mmetsp:Transcript_25578/g.59947  ORF Transcript_25578/g.59947 Transcript_25578/m.59947 type:complete len:237 (+) Transcript_25578:65-775(+)
MRTTCSGSSLGPSASSRRPRTTTRATTRKKNHRPRRLLRQPSMPSLKHSTRSAILWARIWCGPWKLPPKCYHWITLSPTSSRPRWLGSCCRARPPSRTFARWASWIWPTHPPRAPSSSRTNRGRRVTFAPPDNASPTSGWRTTPTCCLTSIGFDTRGSSSTKPANQPRKTGRHLRRRLWRCCPQRAAPRSSTSWRRALRSRSRCRPFRRQPTRPNRSSWSARISSWRGSVRASNSW